MTTVQTNAVSNTLLENMNGKKTAAGSIDAAQERFMTLLVTQMKNQDPLNPLDNAQVTSQLAQLSTVTGIEKLNTTLESLIASSQLGQSFQAAGMIGHVVSFEGNRLQLEDGYSALGVDLPQDVDNLTVTIKDTAGTVIREFNLGAQKTGVLPLNWKGETSSGSIAPNGTYTFEVTAVAAGQKINATTLSYDEVTSVSNSSQGIKLNLGSNGSISTSEVTQIL